MCGIVGIYNFTTNRIVSEKLITEMSDLIRHRGPDDSGVYVDGNIGFGHRRLSIIDLSSNGQQPMQTADGKMCITFNGEVYNFQELKTDLLQKGYSFKSNTDTEVILYLYKEYGESCLALLRGMFAFAIWDKDASILFMARDRIGKKPLYYYYDGARIVFASELKSVVADPDVHKEINYEAFSDYFRYLYVPDPKTIYKNIYKLEPGHCLKCTKDGIEKKQYWDVSFSNVMSESMEEISEELLKMLQESVRIRMISDVPLGAFLSGGIDSSAMVALMAREQINPVTTCSIGFDSEKFDEITFARIVSKKFNTNHHEFTVKNNAEAVLPVLTDSFDEPFADSSAVPTYYVSKLARQKVTVAISGDGGDENFAGYEKYTTDVIENKIRDCIPSIIRKSVFPVLSKVFSGSSHVMFKKAASLTNSLSFEAGYGYYLTNTEVRDALWSKMINTETKRKTGGYDSFSVTDYYYNKADGEDHLSKALYTDLKTYLPGGILVKVDRMSMANSLEVRSPVLDHKIIEFAAKIPIGFKYDKGEKKKVLKKSFESILPHDILYRKKMGFSVPLSEWFRHELKKVTSDLFFSKDSGLSHFFNMTVIQNIWSQHQSLKMNNGAILWSLLKFELWFRKSYSQKF